MPGHGFTRARDLAALTGAAFIVDSRSGLVIEIPLTQWATDPRTADPRWKLRMTEEEAMELGAKIRNNRTHN